MPSEVDTAILNDNGGEDDTISPAGPAGVDDGTESVSSVIQRGVQGARRIQQQRGAVRSDTKMLCLKLTLEMIR